MLNNEKHVGCLVTQKSYTKDFLGGKQVKNDGVVKQYRFEDHHDAIVDRDIFKKVSRSGYEYPIFLQRIFKFCNQLPLTDGLFTWKKELRHLLKAQRVLFDLCIACIL